MVDKRNARGNLSDLKKANKSPKTWAIDAESSKVWPEYHGQHATEFMV
jgi:hypothetical protein